MRFLLIVSIVIELLLLRSLSRGKSLVILRLISLRVWSLSLLTMLRTSWLGISSYLGISITVLVMIVFSDVCVTKFLDVSLQGFLITFLFLSLFLILLRPFLALWNNLSVITFLAFVFIKTLKFIHLFFFLGCLFLFIFNFFNF